MCMFISSFVSRMPTTWRSCRSPSSQARPNQCSTAGPEPCTTLLLTTTTTTTFSIRHTLLHPLRRHWSPLAGQPVPPLCLPLWLPPRPLPPLQPAYAGTSPQPDSLLRVKPDPPNYHTDPCPSPARTWHATCVRSYVMLTSIQTRGLSTHCRSSPLKEGVHPLAPSAPLVRLDWMEGATEMAEEEM